MGYCIHKYKFTVAVVIVHVSNNEFYGELVSVYTIFNPFLYQLTITKLLQ